MVPVRLLGLPVSLRARAQEHDQDLLRELALIRVGADQPEAGSVPARLLSLADELRDIYGAFSAGPDAEIEAATHAGLESVDVTYQVPLHALSFIRRVAQTLEEAEEFSRAGKYLLTVAAPPDVAAYRRWVFAEFDRQIQGGPAVSWPDALATIDSPSRPSHDSRAGRIPEPVDG